MRAAQQAQRRWCGYTEDKKERVSAWFKGNSTDRDRTLLYVAAKLPNPYTNPRSRAPAARAQHSQSQQRFPQSSVVIQHGGGPPEVAPWHPYLSRAPVARNYPQGPGHLDSRTETRQAGIRSVIFNL